MPELPDVSLYVKRIEERILGEPLEAMRFHNPFVLRSIDPKPDELIGRKAVRVSRLGKRIVIELEGQLFIVIHLMIAGRFTWVPLIDPHAKTNKANLASWKWPSGLLSLVESSTKKRASVNLAYAESLQQFTREGLDVLAVSFEEFRTRLRAESHTVKWALTDPHTFDGIGNAYSDEILFVAKVSPNRMTRSLSDEESHALYDACRSCLSEWIDKLQELYPDFPKPSQITAFRKEFFVHGRYKQPCKVCGAPVQRIVYADNETNYCAQCQNQGKILADRSLSRLLK